MSDKALQRRPIGLRNSALAKDLAMWLAKRGITPNQISLASVAYAAIGAVSLGLAGLGDWGGRPALYLIGALMIELRLLCNMLDGLVAVEGGKGTPSGALFNEVPDRFADIFLFVGAGCATGSLFGVVLGFVGALLAVLTAYARALGTSLGLIADFSGPMAKPHRMQALAASCVIAAALSSAKLDHAAMLIVLIAILFGTGFTLARRLTRSYQALMRGPDTRL